MQKKCNHNNNNSNNNISDIKNDFYLGKKTIYLMRKYVINEVDKLNTEKV